MELPKQLTKNNGIGSRRLQALVICSNLVHRETLKALLGACGVEPVFLTTMNETIGRLGKDRTRLLLCKASLPDGTFHDIIRAIEDRGLNVPVIVCSDVYDKDLYIEAMAMGAFDYLAFPCRPDEVAWVVKNAVIWSSVSLRAHA